SLGGEIEVESTVGTGSIFRVILPRASAALRAATTRPETPSAVRRARVLVIDDEPLVGTAIRRLLQSTHDVEHTTRAREALEDMRRGTRWDVIFCDLMMPDLTGMDVYETLARELPEQAARMVFVTGGTFTPRASEFVDARPHRVVANPFR